MRMKNLLFEQLAVKLQDLSKTDSSLSLPVVPPNRKSPNFIKTIDPSTYSSAAVLICCYPKLSGQFYFPIIKRQKYKGVHANQMGLPGGKPQSSDASLWETALRECEEELGINTQSIQYVGKLSDVFIPPSQFRVTPFVAKLNRTPPPFVLQQREVAKVYSVSLKQLQSWVVSYQKMNLTSTSIEMPGFDLESEFIWGATAMILFEFKEILNELIVGI